MNSQSGISEAKPKHLAIASGSPPAGGLTTYRGPFSAMTVLFFMWGFMTVWNDILIPRFKEAFALSYFQAMLVQLAFFGAYGVGALIYYLLSVSSGDPINRIGYRKGVVLGLLIAAGLFCSVMWSNIFSLAIEGLGPLKSQASSLLVMAILGGAILPPMQGALADKFGIQSSFVIPMLAFAYIGFYGLYGYRAGRGREGITR
jgi:FHS family L-fucose permease-like MFS transporter